MQQMEGMPVPCLLEIPCLPSSKDVCIDPSNESTLYIAGSTSKHMLGIMHFPNSTYGQVFHVDMSLDNKKADVVSVKMGLDVLAGIEVVNDKIWVVELYHIFTLHKETKKLVLQWKGNDGKGMVWMADHVIVFDEDKILCPVFLTASEFKINQIAKCNCLTSGILLYYQLATAWMCGECI